MSDDVTKYKALVATAMQDAYAIQAQVRFVANALDLMEDGSLDGVAHLLHGIADDAGALGAMLDTPV